MEGQTGQRLSTLSVQLISETISQILSLLGLDEVVTHVSLWSRGLWPIPWHAIIKMNQNFPMMSLMRNKRLSFLNYWHKNDLTKCLYLLTCIKMVTILKFWWGELRKWNEWNCTQIKFSSQNYCVDCRHTNLFTWMSGKTKRFSSSFSTSCRNNYFLKLKYLIETWVEL